MIRKVMLIAVLLIFQIEIIIIGKSVITLQDARIADLKEDIANLNTSIAYVGMIHEERSNDVEYVSDWGRKLMEMAARNNTSNFKEIEQ